MVSDEDHRDRTTPGDGSTQLSPRKRTLVGVGVLVLVVAATATFLVTRELRDCPCLAHVQRGRGALRPPPRRGRPGHDAQLDERRRGRLPLPESGEGLRGAARGGSPRSPDRRVPGFGTPGRQRADRLHRADQQEAHQAGEGGRERAGAARAAAACRSRPTGRGCAPRRLPLPRVLRARRGPVQRRGRRTSPFPRRAPGRGGGRRHPGRARGRRAHSGARGRWSRPLPRHHRPECPATHARVDGGVGASAGDRSRER